MAILNAKKHVPRSNILTNRVRLQHVMEPGAAHGSGLHENQKFHRVFAVKHRKHEDMVCVRVRIWSTYAELHIYITHYFAKSKRVYTYLANWANMRVWCVWSAGHGLGNGGVVRNDSVVGYAMYAVHA